MVHVSFPSTHTAHRVCPNADDRPTHMRLREPQATSVLLRLDGIQTHGGIPVVNLQTEFDGVPSYIIWSNLHNGKLCQIEVPLNTVLKIKLTVDSKRYQHAVEKQLVIVVNTRPHSCCMCGGTATDPRPCNCYGLFGTYSPHERIMENNRRNEEAGPEPVVPVPANDDGMSVATLSGESDASASDEFSDSAGESSDSAGGPSHSVSDDEDDVVEVFCE